MKLLAILLVLLGIHQSLFGDQLTPSQLDPKFAEVREKAFTPWGYEEQARVDWQTLSPTHIPVFGEHQPNGLKRGIYIPNPGTGYWTLDGLSEESLWTTEREKLKINDELVSGGSYENESGNKVYWALWAPRNKAYLIKEKMRELGIIPASVDIDQAAKDEDERGTRLDAATLYTFTGAMVFHDPGGIVKYDLTITKGQVSGWQYWGEDKEPVGKIVGGWFDFDRRRLSVVIQGANHVQAMWRTQLKQFHLDIAAKQVILDYELYDYGKTVETPLVGKPHILDQLDRIEHLVK